MRIPLLLFTLPILLMLGLFAAMPIRAEQPLPQVMLPPSGLTTAQLAVVINDADPLSREIGEAYQRLRGIPADNVLRVKIPSPPPRLSPKIFTKVRAKLVAATPPGVQAYVLAWNQPYRVGCMSITSAFTFGYDEAYCAKGCKPTKSSPYFNSKVRLPFDELGIRPAMLLPAPNLAAAETLIRRGISADGLWPKGTGYLVETPDKARSVRKVLFGSTIEQLGGIQRLRHVRTEALRHADDILFYFTGSAKVKSLNTLVFLPGAMADHLTSAGGVLNRKAQMPVTRWLEAGATASYGTVVEPCNMLPKFPHPGIAMHRVLTGETLIEAYWKSVDMPGQGLFVGEPLAAPFSGAKVRREDGRIRVTARTLPSGMYAVYGSNDGLPPYSLVEDLIAVGGYPQEFSIPDTGFAYLMVRPQ